MKNENLIIGNKRIFFPNLDGIRTIAFLMVFVGHCYSRFPLHNKYTDPFLNSLVDRFTILSNMGVNLFFVLSGFLISYLLFDENDLFGKINIKKFYVRRILRIWPVYYLVVFLGLFIIFFVFHLLKFEDYSLKSFINYLLFMVNFEHINKELTHPLISVLWSVSVEEQFYLFWPLLLTIVPKKKYVLLFISLIIIASIYRYSQAPESYRLINYHTLAVMIYLTMGALGAYICKYHIIKLESLFSAPKIIWIGLYASLILYFYFDRNIIVSKFQTLFEGFFYSIVFLLIILEQNYAKNSFYKMSNIKFLDKYGKYTYGLYSYHFFAIFFVYTINTRYLNLDDTNIPLLFAQYIVALLLSYLIAWLSFNYYEKYFLSKKKKYDLLQK